MNSAIRQENSDDTIVARSTAPGPGAIAIVRVDGPGTLQVLRRMFEPRGPLHPIDAPRQAIFGNWAETPPAKPQDGAAGAQRHIIDEGITIFFKAPHSFTGNDLAELQCHGSTAIVRSLIAAAMRLGARLAEPGEFTRRAFLNNRLDLAQAEAVGDLIRAETDAAARMARSQLAGGLSRRIRELRANLIDLAAEIEARIDFPEEGLAAEDRTRLQAVFDGLESGLRGLIASRGRGRLLREGARIALVGPPNVGKSSLLNALARTERAIVTPHPGTTRDTIECTIDLAGIAVTIVDTAGLRSGGDEIERLGIERTHRAMCEADIVVEVRDATGEIEAMNFESEMSDGRSGDSSGGVRRPEAIVFNKIDRLDDEDPNSAQLGHRRPGDAESARTFCVSALTGRGIEELEKGLEALLLDAAAGETDKNDQSDTQALGEPGGQIAVGARHAALLESALASIAQAQEAWDAQMGDELVMIDLREALVRLDEILGLGLGEAILDRVFEKFCLGK